MTKPLSYALFFFVLSFSYPTQYFADTKKKRTAYISMYNILQSKNTEADTLDDESNEYKR